MKIRTEIWIGYEFFGEKIIFPSTPVLGINNDQSLLHVYLAGYPGGLVHVPNFGGWQGRRTSYVPPSPPPPLIFKPKFKFFVTLPS